MLTVAHSVLRADVRVERTWQTGGEGKSNLLQPIEREEAATLSRHHRLFRFRKFSLAGNEMRNEIEAEAVTGSGVAEGKEIETQGSTDKTGRQFGFFKTTERFPPS